MNFSNFVNFFGGFDSDGALNSPGGVYFPVLSGPAGCPQPGFRLVGTVLAVHPCTVSPQFSSMKIAPGEILSSADKREVNPTRAIELFS